MPPLKGVFLAGTKQHCGKTTTCLALMEGIRGLLGNKPDAVGFLKPVGQAYVNVTVGNGNTKLKVDKDVVLFKEHFKLDSCSYEDMSPVVIPRNYTKDFVDGKITEASQIAAVERAFRSISSRHQFTLTEGTGHCGVGAIVNLDNARVASILGLQMILVVNGGLGSAFDDLSLNRLACAHNGVKIRGVIVNKVVHDKVEMIRDYMGRALRRWHLPLLGVVPDAEYLAQPSMLDFQQLFLNNLIVGKEHLLRHYDQITLVSMDLRRFLNRLRAEKHSKTLFVTHSSRMDIILGLISHSQIHERIWGEPFRAGLILAGHLDVDEVEKKSIIDAVTAQDKFPVLFSSRTTYETMLLMSNYTAKLSYMDPKRTSKAIEHYVPHIDMVRAVEG